MFPASHCYLSNFFAVSVPSQVIWDSLGVLCRYSGNCTIADVVEASARVKGGQDLDKLRHCIHDFSQAESIEGGAVAVAVIAVNLGGSEVNRKIKVALVMSASVALQSNAGIHAAAASRPTQVFESLDTALDWVFKKAGS